ncbi:MAG: redoxin domain-containing protein [Pontiella sp.]|nr:redoxin domain-containing protein [Pontiella sp.]MBT8045716.1 redoxin domain-containing protein [Pontiella sp.]
MMKKYVTAGILAVAISSLTGVQAAVEVGAAAPDFTLTDSKGNSHNLSDFKGKYVVLEWVNYGCPFVKKFYKVGAMQDLQKKYTAKDVVWLSICSSASGKQGHMSAEEVNAANAQNGFAATAYLIDESGDVGRLYGARTTPHMFIVNPDGSLGYQGGIDSVKSTKSEDIENATNYVAAFLDASLKGETPAVTTSQPYGCGVKYAKK